jgi:DNA adenine methylase
MNQQAMQVHLKPMLKWAGGKRWLIPHLLPIWERHLKHVPFTRLVEPFCGGLAVALGLRPERALLNDINEHLINFYRWVQRGLTIRIELGNDQDLYYRHRDRFNELIQNQQHDTREAAELFYYLNRTGYNGLCRFNNQGLFNVPFGRYKQIKYERDFLDYRELLAQWSFTNVDFEQLQIEETDFVYADPPYDVEFRQYASGGFTWDDQVRLARWLADLNVPVVASNQATERIVELYDSLGFDIQFLNGPRMISCTGDRTKAREILAVKGITE